MRPHSPPKPRTLQTATSYSPSGIPAKRKRPVGLACGGPAVPKPDPAQRVAVEGLDLDDDARYQRPRFRPDDLHLQRAHAAAKRADVDPELPVGLRFRAGRREHPAPADDAPPEIRRDVAHEGAAQRLDHLGLSEGALPARRPGVCRGGRRPPPPPAEASARRADRAAVLRHRGVPRGGGPSSPSLLALPDEVARAAVVASPPRPRSTAGPSPGAPGRIPSIRVARGASRRAVAAPAADSARASRRARSGIRIPGVTRKRWAGPKPRPVAWGSHPSPTLVTRS